MYCFDTVNPFKQTTFVDPDTKKPKFKSYYHPNRLEGVSFHRYLSSFFCYLTPLLLFISVSCQSLTLESFPPLCIWLTSFWPVWKKLRLSVCLHTKQCKQDMQSAYSAISVRHISSWSQGYKSQNLTMLQYGNATLEIDLFFIFNSQSVISTSMKHMKTAISKCLVCQPKMQSWNTSGVPSFRLWYLYRCGVYHLPLEQFLWLSWSTTESFASKNQLSGSRAPTPIEVPPWDSCSNGEWLISASAHSKIAICVIVTQWQRDSILH